MGARLPAGRARGRTAGGLWPFGRGRSGGRGIPLRFVLPQASDLRPQEPGQLAGIGGEPLRPRQLRGIAVSP